MSDAFAPPDAPSGDAASIPFDQSVEVVKRAFSIGSRTVLRPFLVLSVGLVLLNGLQPISTIVQGLGADLSSPGLVLTGNILAWVIGSITVVGSLLISALVLGLYRSLRVGLLEGPEAVAEQGAFRIARSRFGMALVSVLLLAIIVGVGLALCILPGIAAALFLGMMPFLVVAADDSIPDAFTRSGKLFIANPGPLLAAYGGAIAIQVLAVVIGAVLGVVIGGISAFVGVLIEFPATAIGIGTGLSSFVGGLLGIPFGYAVLLLIGGTFVAVETNDSGLSAHLDDDILT